ncbi:MAG: helix-turn-helix transcriptional regulator [Ruminococcaceae bacterium]|nr:helix-turn-helix transcriptional regulator [Oscillospiraceae bacterium]
MEGCAAMFDRVENLTILASNQGPVKQRNVIACRKNHILIFLTGGSNHYRIGGREMIGKRGDLVFIPQGAGYEYEVGEGCVYTYITFTADIDRPEMRIFSLANYLDRERFDARFSNLWNFGNPSDKYKCYAAVYGLLSYLSGIEHLAYSDKKKFSVIEPAVNYLKAAIFDSSLNVDTLHALCGISDTYFRKIFAARFGTSPIKYITARRLAQAKAILDSGDFDTVSNVALAVGYRDPLYFSRVFKKTYGYSPSEHDR